jgi:hypothetical protein
MTGKSIEMTTSTTSITSKTTTTTSSEGNGCQIILDVILTSVDSSTTTAAADDHDVPLPAPSSAVSTKYDGTVLMDAPILVLDEIIDGIL